MAKFGMRKNEGWKKAGLIGLGTVLGILLSLNFSAVAQREAKTPIPYEDLQLLSAVFGKIKSDYVEAVPDDKLIKEAINGMVHGLDPHSDFLDAEAFKDLHIQTAGKFGGLGIEVGIEDGIVRVTSPIEDTPAFRAGIKSGDLIVKIDDTATRGLPLSKAVEKMRGKPGTSVVLTIVRKDVDTPLTFTLTREEINFKSVRAKMIEPGYGFVRVVQFQERTGEDLAKALKDLYKNGDFKGLVLDLRSDPGGLLNQAVAVSAAFLPKDVLVVYTDGRTPDARMRLTATRGQLRAARRGLFPRPAGRREEGADGRAGRRRHRVGVRNRRRRAAGSQARDRAGQPDVRQGLRADDPAARQQRRPQAHHRALLHAGGPLHPGQGHRAGHRRRRRPRFDEPHPRSQSRPSSRDGRPAPQRPHRCSTSVGRASRDQARREDGRGEQGRKPPRSRRASSSARRRTSSCSRRLNQLKGLPVIASTKAVAANAAVPDAPREAVAGDAPRTLAQRPVRRALSFQR